MLSFLLLTVSNTQLRRCSKENDNLFHFDTFQTFHSNIHFQHIKTCIMKRRQTVMLVRECTERIEWTFDCLGSDSTVECIRKNWIFFDCRLNSWEKMITTAKWVMIWKADDDQDDSLPFSLLVPKTVQVIRFWFRTASCLVYNESSLLCGDSWFVSWSETMNYTLDWKKEDEKRNRGRRGSKERLVMSYGQSRKRNKEWKKKKRRRRSGTNDWKEWWKMKIGRKTVMNERWSGCNSCECSDQWKM